MKNDFLSAIEDMEKEKGISKEMIIEHLKDALIAAYKKHYGETSNVEVDYDADMGTMTIRNRYEIVEEVEDEYCQIALEDAREIDETYEVGDFIEYEIEPREFGRIAAQNTKQNVKQKINETEREMVFDEFVDRQGEVINGIIQRKSNRTLFINLGTTEGILPGNEQVPGEHFDVNDRIKAYIMDVKKTSKGPQIFLSRSHPSLVKRLFEFEVPEIQEGVVEIRGIAREAGSRTKMAVYTADEGVDPVGACVGNRGTRVQAVVDELFGEKIDIIVWSEDPAELISNALSPATCEEVYIDEEERAAMVIVPDFQLSLAIGKSGQNVRLAAKVCGWKIDIKSHSQYYAENEEIVEYGEEGDSDAAAEAEEEIVTYETEAAPIEAEAAEAETASTEETEEAVTEVTEAETEESAEEEPEATEVAADDAAAETEAAEEAPEE